MGTVRTATVRGARRSPCKVSRVLSRRRPGRFPLWLRFGFVGGCGPSLGNERDAATASRSREGRPPRKKALDPPSPGRVALNHGGTKCDCKNCENNENSTRMGSGASAGECAAAVASECVFGSVFSDMACGMHPAPPLLWPCLLLPMPKGMAAGHQQALAAQAEQRRIRGR